MNRLVEALCKLVDAVDGIDAIYIKPHTIEISLGDIHMDWEDKDEFKKIIKELLEHPKILSADRELWFTYYEKKANRIQLYDKGGSISNIDLKILDKVLSKYGYKFSGVNYIDEDVGLAIFYDKIYMESDELDKKLDELIEQKVF